VKTGAKIVADIENWPVATLERSELCDKHWPTIRAALLAYEPPKTALRTIVDAVEAYQSGASVVTLCFTVEEVAVARAELDELEKK
jgi:hypothetical protein